MAGKADVDTTFADYANAVDEIKRLAPNADIYLQSLIPETNATVNRDYFIPFNAKIKDLADSDTTDNVYFVDVYSALEENGSLNPIFIGANTRQSHGINGHGYLR